MPKPTIMDTFVAKSKYGSSNPPMKFRIIEDTYGDGAYEFSIECAVKDKLGKISWIEVDQLSEPSVKWEFNYAVSSHIKELKARIAELECNQLAQTQPPIPQLPPVRVLKEGSDPRKLK